VLAVVARVLFDPAAWGALLSGMGSVTAALLSVRGVKKRARSDCDQRISDIRAAFKRGTEFEPRKKQVRRSG